MSNPPLIGITLDTEGCAVFGGASNGLKRTFTMKSEAAACLSKAEVQKTYFASQQYRVPCIGVTFDRATAQQALDVGF
jgi:hypothetical protein